MTDHKCTACGEPLQDHLGLIGACAELQRARESLGKIALMAVADRRKRSNVMADIKGRCEEVLR